LTLYSQSSVGRQKTFLFLIVHLLVVTTKQSTIAHVRHFSEAIIAFKTCSLFWNVPYKRVYTTETTALSRSGKKTPTEIRVCGSNIYVILSVVLQPNWGLGWLFVEVSRSHSVKHRQNRWDFSKQVTSPSQRPLPTQHKRPRSVLLSVSEPATPGKKPLQVYSSDRTASRFDVIT
jgi:hypothetical protein